MQFLAYGLFWVLHIITKIIFFLYIQEFWYFRQATAVYPRLHLESSYHSLPSAGVTACLSSSAGPKTHKTTLCKSGALSSHALPLFPVSGGFNSCFSAILANDSHHFLTFDVVGFFVLFFQRRMQLLPSWYLYLILTGQKKIGLSFL